VVNGWKGRKSQKKWEKTQGKEKEKVDRRQNNHHKRGGGALGKFLPTKKQKVRSCRSVEKAKGWKRGGGGVPDGYQGDTRVEKKKKKVSLEQ